MERAHPRGTFHWGFDASHLIQLSTNRFFRVKAGVHIKAVFWLGIMVLMQMSRLRFKRSRMSMFPHIYVLGRFVKFVVIFRYIWR